MFMFEFHMQTDQDFTPVADVQTYEIANAKFHMQVKIIQHGYFMSQVTGLIERIYCDTKYMYLGALVVEVLGLFPPFPSQYLNLPPLAVTCCAVLF